MIECRDMISPAELSVENRDKTLVNKLQQLDAARGVLPKTAFGLTCRNRELSGRIQQYYTTEAISDVTKFLVQSGTLRINKRNGYKVTVDGEDQSVYRISATETDVNGDMSKKDWIRDPALIGKSNFELWSQDPVRYAAEGEEAKSIIMSTMHKMSSQAQLDRFAAIINTENPEDKKNYLNWPYIVIEPHPDESPEDLNANNHVDWRHMQDAWQMLGITALDALASGLIDVKHIKQGNKLFLASMAPFLDSVNFTSVESSGSWEEQMARKTSVIAVETALLHKIRQLSDKPEFAFLQGDMEKGEHQQMLDRLIQQGLEALGQRLPFESPDYPKDDPRYRTADATLVYLLDYGIPQLLADSKIEMKANAGKPMTGEAIEDMILEQLESLHDPITHGMHRYGVDEDTMKDSYLGINYNTDGIQEKIGEMKQKLKAEAGDGPIDLNKKAAWRQEIVEEGSPAAWVHPNAQVSSWAAKRFLETGKEKYLTLATNYLNWTLATITGEEEHTSLLASDGTHHIQKVDPLKITEAWSTVKPADGGAFHVSSPHWPLNWGVGECKRALGLNILAVEKYEKQANANVTDIFTLKNFAQAS